MAVKEVPKSKQEKQRELMEYIHGYTPSERLPFACRLCKFQGASEEELWQHRAGEAHKRAVELEKKACFCRLCRKQFTSAVQLSEHLKGAAHAATLERRMRASGQCVEIKPTGVGAGAGGGGGDRGRPEEGADDALQAISPPSSRGGTKWKGYGKNGGGGGGGGKGGHGKGHGKGGRSPGGKGKGKGKGVGGSRGGKGKSGAHRRSQRGAAPISPA